jgi:hypothetical protein
MPTCKIVHEPGSTRFGLRTWPVLRWWVVITFADVILVDVRAGRFGSAISSMPWLVQKPMSHLVHTPFITLT